MKNKTILLEQIDSNKLNSTHVIFILLPNKKLSQSCSTYVYFTLLSLVCCFAISIWLSLTSHPITWSKYSTRGRVLIPVPQPTSTARLNRGANWWEEQNSSDNANQTRSGFCCVLLWSLSVDSVDKCEHMEEVWKNVWNNTRPLHSCCRVTSYVSTLTLVTTVTLRYCWTHYII